MLYLAAFGTAARISSDVDICILASPVTFGSTNEGAEKGREPVESSECLVTPTHLGIPCERKPAVQETVCTRCLVEAYH